MNSDATTGNSHAQEPIRLVPVETKEELERFIRIPWPLYAGDRNWTPPLLLERRQHLSPKNPLFQHLRWKAWLALRGEREVGRVSTQIDALHLERYGTQTGFFGMLEAEDDKELFDTLLGTAEGWLRDEGMKRVQGPFNLSINEECGLLVDGFDSPPFVMMGHARPYYAKRVEEMGYIGVQDLLAYNVRPDFPIPPIMHRLVDKLATQVRLRTLNRANFRSEMSILRDIFNDAWSENWGFVPFTEEEFQEVGNGMKHLVDDGFIQIAEMEGEPVSMIVLLPNINEIISDLDGQLFPTGWLKLLWRLKVSYPKTARIPLMGVRKQLQKSRLGPGLAFMVINALREPVIRRGIEDVEMSWILESNSGMKNIIEAIGGRMTKRYRIYEKGL